MEITGELKVALKQYKEVFKKEAPIDKLPEDTTIVDVMDIIYRSCNEGFDMFDMYIVR